MTSARKSAQQSGGYVVVDGRQVHHDGHLYGAGETIVAPERDAVEWLAAGLVTAKEGK